MYSVHTVNLLVNTLWGDSELVLITANSESVHSYFFLVDHLVVRIL